MTGMIETIRDAIMATGYELYGLRMLPPGSTAAIGDVLERSYRWEDGEPTDGQLDGTCAIEIDPDRIERTADKAMTLLCGDGIRSWGYDGEIIALIGGDCCPDEPQDEGETIIAQATVLAVWPRP